jgi:Protein of unknown function (DUF3617)
MKSILTLAFLSGIAASTTEPTPLDIKIGEWEYTVAVQITNTPTVGSSSSSAGPPATSRNCVKKEDVARLDPTLDPASSAKSCKMVVIGSSPTKFEAKTDCRDSGSKSTSRFVIEALSSESIKFSLLGKGTASGHPVWMNLSGTGKWLGAACTN